MSQALTVYCNQENTPSTVTMTLVTQSTGDRAVVSATYQRKAPLCIAP